MEKAQPGHTVEFQGLKGAAHLNGTTGTLVKWLKKEQRWRVRCDSNRELVNAKPDNLMVLPGGAREVEEPISRPTHTMSPEALAYWRAQAAEFQVYDGPEPGMFTDDPAVALAAANTNNFAGSQGVSPSAWTQGLTQEDQYEWLSNCYQMRCDDDYAYGGCNLHGPYDPDATPESLAEDFLVFCLLAHRSKAIPSDWDWSAFLKVAANHVVFAFEKSDAKERWGSESVFEAQMGGRSLRYTGEIIYKSGVMTDENSDEHDDAVEEVYENKSKAQKQVGGTKAWTTFLKDLSESVRFS